jgi:hypothetical protein
MVYIVILGAIMVLVGNNTKTAYSRPLLIAGLVVTALGVVLMLFFRPAHS